MSRYQYSMIVLTYNQQDYVREAVKAAFDQDFEPLEILISDDCSQDDTFRIITEEVSQYSGPHHVVVNRNDENMGLVAHINKVVGLASGSVLVPASGDDISYPERMRRIAEVFEWDDPLLVHSQAIAINTSGEMSSFSHPDPTFNETTDPKIAATSLSLYLGASGAWSRELFEKYGPLKNPKAYEDLILGFRAALENRISYIPDPLLYYRVGVGISHVLAQKVPSDEFVRKRNKMLDHASVIYRERIADARTFGLDETSPVMRKLQTALLLSQARRGFHDNRWNMLAAHWRNPGLGLKAFFSESLHRIRGR